MTKGEIVVTETANGVDIKLVVTGGDGATDTEMKVASRMLEVVDVYLKMSRERVKSKEAK